MSIHFRPLTPTIGGTEMAWSSNGWARALPPPDPSTRVERPPVDTGWRYLTPSAAMYYDGPGPVDILKFRIVTVNGVDTCEIVRLDP